MQEGPLMKSSFRVCGKCGHGLSQYNPDPLCASCSRGGDIARIPDRAWRDEQVRRALSAWDFGELLRLLRRRSGLSQMAVRSLTGLTQSFISDLERGRKHLGGGEAIIDFLNGLGLPADLRPLLLTPFGEPDRGASNGPLDPALPWNADRMVTSLEFAVGGVMKRRGVLALSGAGLTQYVLQSTIAAPEAMASMSPNGARVTIPLITSLEATTDALRHMDASSGSGSLAATSLGHLKILVRLLKHGSYDEARGRRLAAATADAATQAGWYMFDGGNHAKAQRLFLAALRAAHASGDSRLTAAALSFLAIHGYSVGDPRDAVTAARTARLSISDRDAPALQAMLLTRQARGHARLREESAARAALEEARALCAQGRGEDDPRWLYWIKPGEILGQTASCLLDLGRPTEAAESFDAARHELSQEEIRTTAQFLSRAATAHMQTKNPDAGWGIAQEVLSLVDGVHSARLDDHLRSMLGEVRRFEDSPAARDLLERGESVMKGRAAA
ncbi:helix-turn-helix domain-containing protein [Streptomyces katsurahamanus]|uniref:Helix-turn-helix domain-containing protein n=2 Tax=Streptomyces katsurahamanus TaxID=2577098 RepID=A0ABW9NWL3_9ACTN|nr:helix-turn-helix domain-containing protein [Streptomyces katsurahamanus]